MNNNWRRLKLWQVADLVYPGMLIKREKGESSWEIKRINKFGCIIGQKNNPHQGLEQWLNNIWTDNERAPKSIDFSVGSFKEAEKRAAEIMGQLK